MQPPQTPALSQGTLLGGGTCAQDACLLACFLLPRTGLPIFSASNLAPNRCKKTSVSGLEQGFYLASKRADPIFEKSFAKLELPRHIARRRRVTAADVALDLATARTSHNIHMYVCMHVCMYV